MPSFLWKGGDSSSMPVLVESEPCDDFMWKSDPAAMTFRQLTRRRVSCCRLGLTLLFLALVFTSISNFVAWNLSIQPPSYSADADADGDADADTPIAHTQHGGIGIVNASDAYSNLRILYNRVPKCGSLVVMRVLDSTQKRNGGRLNFTLTSHPAPYRLSDVRQVGLCIFGK